MARGARPLSPPAPDRALPPYRCVVLGWHGSSDRHLRAIARHHEARGADVIARAPRTFLAMGLPGGWDREARPLADAILARDPRPLVIHAFSNAGYWSTRALLERIHDRVDHRGSILDSAPGFPERPSFLFTARYAGRAMLPSLLAALGLRPAHTHPLLGPPVSAFLGAWHLVARRQVAFMSESSARMIALHRGKPLLSIAGGADDLVPLELVRAFLDRAERDGVLVERVLFDDGGHVRHFVQHRAAYLAAVDRFLTRALARV